MRIVTKGVNEGDQVVVEGLQKISDGSLVAPAAGALSVIGRVELLHPPTDRRNRECDPHRADRQRRLARPSDLAVSANPAAAGQLDHDLYRADAVTIEQSVATPLEQQINGVDRMLYVQSTNANDGSMNQVVTFDVGTDGDVANVLVNNRYSQAQPFLPQDVKNFGVTIKKSLAFPLLVIALYSPDGRYDPTFLSNYALININDALLRVKGVGDIRNLGASEYSMRIWVDPDVLARLSLTVTDIQNAIRNQNIVNPAGSGRRRARAPGPTAHLHCPRPGAIGESRRVRQCRFAREPRWHQRALAGCRENRARRAQLPAVRHVRWQAGRGHRRFPNSGLERPDVASALRDTLASLAKRFPPGITYTVSLDTTKPVTAGIHEIIVTLVEALVLVMLVVFVFLQNWRATLIPLLTVPVSLVAFAVFPAARFLRQYAVAVRTGARHRLGGR